MQGPPPVKGLLCADELINSAVRQASQLRANKKIKNEASKAR